MDPETESSDASSLPWIWFLESLANDKQIDYLTLRNVAMKVPGLSGNAAKHARELLALRCLEGLADMSDGSGEKTGLDLSKRCSVVLYDLTSEAVNLNSGMDGIDLAKWDIRSFVEHKRAHMAKCTLEQLEDMVLEGKDAAAVSLREIIGYKHADRSEDVDMNDGAAKVVSSTCVENSLHQKAASMPWVMDSIPENGEGSCQVGRKVTLSQNDGDVHSKFEKPVEDVDVGDKAFDLCGATSEMMKDGPGNSKKPQVNHIDMDQSSKQRGLDDHHFLIPQDNQKLSSGTPQNVSAQTVLEEEVSEKINSLAKLNAPATANSNQKQAGLPMATQTAVTTSDSNPNSEDLPEAAVEAFQDDLHNKGVSTLVGDNPSDVDESDSEDVDAASLKNFMDSLSTADDWTETGTSLCLKCNKSGPMLHCSICHITVHNGCLGVEPCFDDNGSFRCPFCARSFAAVEYQEIKSRAGIWRRELDVFRRSSPSCKFPKHFLKGKKKNLIISKQDDVSSPMKGHDVDEKGETNCNQPNKIVDHGGHICPEIDGDADVNPSNESPVAGMSSDLPCRGINDTTTGNCDIGAVVEPPILQVEDILPPPVGKNTTTDGTTCQPQVVFTQEPLTSEELEHQKCYASAIYEGDKGYNKKETINENPHESKLKHIRPSRNIPNIKISKTTSNIPYQSYPAHRRRKVPWTEDEENKLREGVKEFYDPESGSVIPWSQILEFGAHVFQPCRTAENLKDKWRNICKKDKQLQT